MIELGLVGSKTGDDIPESVPERKLTKGHAHELTSTGEMLDSVITGILFYATIKSFSGKVIHQLREYEAS